MFINPAFFGIQRYSRKSKEEYNLLSDVILCSSLQQNYQEKVMNYVLLTEHNEGFVAPRSFVPRSDSRPLI